MTESDKWASETISSQGSFADELFQTDDWLAGATRAQSQGAALKGACAEGQTTRVRRTEGGLENAPVPPVLDGSNLFGELPSIPSSILHLPRTFSDPSHQLFETEGRQASTSLVENENKTQKMTISHPLFGSAPAELDLDCSNKKSPKHTTTSNVQEHTDSVHTEEEQPKSIVFNLGPETTKFFG